VNGPSRPTDEHDSPTEKLDQLLALARRSFRYAWLAAFGAVIGGLLGVGLGVARGREYESRTVVMYRELIPTRVLQGPDGSGMDRDMANRFHEMALSAPVLERLVEAHRLYPETRRRHGTAAAVDEMRQAIRFQSRGGGTFHLSYRGRTPEEARAVTSDLADSVIARERNLQVEGVEATREFLSSERLRVEELLHDKERALARFLADHPEFAQETQAGLAGATGASVRANEERLKKDARLQALHRQRARLRSRLEGSGRVAIPAEQGADVAEAEQKLGAARRELADDERELRSLLNRYTERHPDVAAARRRVERAERRVAMARETVQALRRAEVRQREPVGEREREQIQRELQRIDGAIVTYLRGGRGGEGERAEDWVVELEAEWARLSREVAEARDRYDAIESKAFTAEIVAASELAGQGGQLTILDPASYPTRPAGIGLRILGMAGMIVFAGLGCMFAIGLALADDRILDGRDLQRLGIARPLAVIPASGKIRRRRGRAGWARRSGGKRRT
jgi:predicted  nucleic acid-binding Zn-ribbon protein